MEKSNIFEIKNIYVNYDDLKVLHNISIHIKEGEIVAIMGPNGCGKTTTIKSMFGLTKTQSGEILFENKHIRPISHTMVKKGIAYVPQGRRVFTDLTVEENIEMGGYFLNDKKETKIRMKEVLEYFPELKNKLKEKSGDLSGGQQQMLAMVRGLMTRPKLLLLDEPTLGLSPKIVKDMFKTIYEINQRTNMSIVIVEHNIKSLLPIVNRVYVLDKGQIVFEGDAQKFEKGEVFEKVFLGMM